MKTLAKIAALVTMFLLLPTLASAESWFEVESEGNAHAVWMSTSGQQPGPEYFYGTQIGGTTVVNMRLTMYFADDANGNPKKVFIHREDVSGENLSCNYEGTFSNSTHVSGTYYCSDSGNVQLAPHNWMATIDLNH